ncbi:MAG: hypothetical protein ACW964_15300, partial [Candidatus Hodarchaeales archaeon]
MSNDYENEINDNKSGTNDILESKNQIIVSLVADFNPERRKLAISYTRTSRRYGLRLTIISFIISIGILISKVTVYFKEILDQLQIIDPILQVGIFFIVGSILISFWELPLAFYLHSRLSRRYGLSKLTNKKWILRYAKAEAIALAIGFFLMEGFYWFLRNFPDTWWIWGVIALIIISLV